MVVMGKEYGPWVRHDWCPRCDRDTEQTRWLRHTLGEPLGGRQHRIRCNECRSELSAAS